MEGSGSCPLSHGAITTTSPMNEDERHQDIPNNDDGPISRSMTKHELNEEYHKLLRRIPNHQGTRRVKEFQTKFSNYRNNQINMLLPDFIMMEFDLPPIEFKDDWDEKVQTAMDKVTKDIKKTIEKEKQQEMDEDDDDDEDQHPPDIWNDSNNTKEYESEYERCVKMLPYCYPMILGFQAMPVADLGDTKWCYCPFGTHMKTWRGLCGDNVSGGEWCKCNTKMDPKAFVDHLKSYTGTSHNCKYHKYTLDYLSKLYENFNGHGIKHIAFADDKDEYKKIYGIMMNKVVRTMEYWRKEAEEKKCMEEKLAKIQEEKTQLEKTNQDLYKQIEVKEAMMKRLKKRLNLEKAKELDLGQLSFYKEHCDELLSIHRNLQKHLWKEQNKNRAKKNGKIEIEVPNEFRLQTMFDKWHDQKKKDPTRLMGPLSQGGKSRVSNFFQVWDVIYPVAIDEGGPKKQFAGEVMKQMGDLVVTNKTGDKIRLFELNDAGWIPVLDSELDSLDCAEMDRAKAFYRALGRVFALCILNVAHKEQDGPSDEMPEPIPIAINCLPRLYRNFIFREVDPADKIYETGALVDDFFAVQMPKLDLNALTPEKLDETMSAWFDIEGLEGEEADVQLRKTIRERLIDTRSIALSALKEGLTLDGSLPLKAFQLIPFEAVTKIYFGIADLKPNDFLNGEEWRFIDVTHVHHKDENNFCKYIDNHHVLMEALKKLIRKSDSKFLVEFLCFCTGLFFLPDLSVHTEFKLTIEFNAEECHKEALPDTHTCVNTIKFPINAYGGDAEKLKQKLDYSLACSRSSWNMQ